MAELTQVDHHEFPAPHIQACGVVLVVNAEDQTIRAASNNSGELLGVAHGALLGQALETLIGADALAALQQRAREGQPWLEEVQVGGQSQAFQLSLGEYKKTWLVELEPAEGLRGLSGPTERYLNRIQLSSDIEEASLALMEAVHELLGCERAFFADVDGNDFIEVHHEVLKDKSAPSLIGEHAPCDAVAERSVHHHSPRHAIPESIVGPNDGFQVPLQSILTVIRDTKPTLAKVLPEPGDEDLAVLWDASLSLEGSQAYEHLREQGVQACLRVILRARMRAICFIECHFSEPLALNAEAKA
ncbi:MAG: hypothetical protein KDB07_08395, partial [Planctomycetes bacterium]|nr:hypothetical protein [Planctomycetota bacterium]